jgi:hypothetical protein
MAGCPAGADDSEYSAIQPIGIDDAKDAICPGNSDEQQSVGVGFVVAIPGS